MDLIRVLAVEEADQRNFHVKIEFPNSFSRFCSVPGGV
jgi:hypothetical protein